LCKLLHHEVVIVFADTSPYNVSSRVPTAKNYKNALVFIPPVEEWAQIQVPALSLLSPLALWLTPLPAQAVRQKMDPAYVRWMPVRVRVSAVHTFTCAITGRIDI
jgi:hypothetical protein